MEKPKEHAEKERKRIEREEDEVTISSDESFPASDPPSFNQSWRDRRRRRQKEDAGEPALALLCHSGLAASRRPGMTEDIL